MKTSILFLLLMVLSLGASAQYHVMEREIEVKPPTFVGTPVNLVADEAIDLADFIVEKMIYPETAINTHREGTEVIEFTVNTDGTLSNFQVINSVSSDIDSEVIRVLQLTNGMWRPGSNNEGYVDMQGEVAVACKIAFYEGATPSTDFKKVATKYFQKGSKLLYTKEHPRRALNQFNAAINYMPYEPNLLVMRGYAKFALGDLNGAVEDWKIVRDKTGIDNLKAIAGEFNDLEGYAELLAEFEFDE